MRNYKQEYFSVFEKRTGRKIADCGSREDARMLVHMDWQNREYRANKMLMSTVIDVETPKSLPTTEIVRVVGDCWESTISYENDMSVLPQIKLPEGQGNPVVV